jgi:gliding motility-associated-like protein
MKKKFTLSHCCKFLAMVLMVLGFHSLHAQTTNFQQTTVQCYAGPTVSFTNTTGTLLPAVNFTMGAGPGQIPVGHVVADVIVEIVWSKTDDGSCTSPTGGVLNLGDVGFQIAGPLGGSRYLAASSQTAIFAPAAGSTFGPPNGAANVINNTTFFRDGGLSGIGNLPVSGDTLAPNTALLSFYRGQSPAGNWSIGAIDDLPGVGSPALCIHSYCITLITCDPGTLSASCQGTATVNLDATGVHAFEFSDIDNLSDVSCLVDIMTFSPASVNCSNLIGGPIPVTMTISDNLGNIDNCISMVTVVDTDPPVIPYCAQPFGTIFTDLYLDVNGTASFDALSVPMSDNCGPITKQVRNITPGSPWQPSIDFNCVIGFQQFFIRGVDPSGNVDSCRLIVNIIDTIPPTAICGRDTAFVGLGPFTIQAINLDNGSRDTCPPITGLWVDVFTGPDPVYTCADLGIDTVSLIVSDASGNLDTCDNAIVVVVDQVAPTAICQNVNVYLNAVGNGTLSATQVDNGSVDFCSISSLDINGLASVSYTCSDIGTSQTVTLHVFDPSGNVDSCTATITVLDTFPPTAICRNFTVNLDASGVTTLQADSLNNNSVDICTGNNINFFINGNSSITFDCSDIATNPNQVILTVEDTYGNQSTCTANVTVLDGIDPVANCATPTIFLTNAGSATITAAQLSLGSSDNCIVVDSFVNVVGISSATFNCSSIFTPQATTLIVRDASGNISTCNTTVNVVDTVTPTALCNANYTATLGANGLATVTPTNIDSASTDNCGLVEYLINGANTQVYTCADVGTLGAILTVRDSSGNNASCASVITVVDNTPPTASCQITNVYLGSSGTIAITPSSVLSFPATGDNCGTITTIFQGGGSNIIYDCDSIGARPVTVIVTDASGNTASCQTTVTVLDTVAPTASCRPVPFTVQLDAFGNGFVVPINVNNGSSDVCGLDTMLVNNVDSFFFTCANIGNTAVTLSVLDESGNQSTCVANVIVADNINPVAVCHDTTLYLDLTGVVTAFPADIDAGSSDNCTFVRRINNLPSVTYNCNQVGVNTAQLLITDGAGNIDQCSANITILDTITPVASCVGLNVRTIFLDNTCFASVPAATFNNSSTDNCSSSLIFRVGGLPNATFTSANLATNPNPVTLTVCDGSNNCSTCNTTVIVRDSTPPTVVCRPDTVQLDGVGNAIVVPNNINAGSSDNCSVPTYTINGGPLVNMTCADIGLNNVTLTGTDQSGNADSCITTVFVQDITAPNASCNSTVTVILDAVTSNGTLTVADVDNSSSDNCTITTYALSRTLFNCGDIPNNTHTVTMVVTDQSGNTDFCTTEVTVLDTVAPVAICRSTPLNLSLVGSVVSTSVAVIDNGSFDNCAIANRTLSPSSFSCSDLGNNTVTLTVTDSSGNSGTCTATVNVSDITAPTPFCSNPTVRLDANGTVTLAATDLAPSSFDNCSIDVMLVGGLDSVTFNCANLGQNVATIFMQDPSGNGASCPSTITVIDDINPVADCIGTPVQLSLDLNGAAVLNPMDLNGASTDNCTIVNYTASQTTFACSDIPSSPNNVTLTVTDQSGNTNSCNAQVSVVDTVRPVPSCQPVTVNIHLNPGGVASVNATMFNAGTSDACGIASLSFSGASNLVTCADVGNLPITLVATDNNGNIDSCTTTLTVLDTVSPTINCNSIIVNLDAFGNATVDSATAGLYTVSDACGISSILLNGGTAVNYTCGDVGPNIIGIITVDASGNAASCNAVVTIQDVTAPSITCAVTTQYLDPNGNLVIDPTWITASIIEACGVDTTFTNPDTLTCINVGPFNAVTLTVTDVNGNTSTCNGNIEVIDTVPPVMVCRDTAVCISGGFVNVTAANVDGGTTDACGLSAIQTINGSNNVIFTCANIGIQTVILERQDVNGNINTCQALVTVQDCNAPTAVCQGNYTASIGVGGFVTIQAIEVDFGSSDDCGIDSTTFKIDGQDSLIYGCSAIGAPFTVMFTVSDLAGNTDTCFSTITIQDTVSPVARCGGPINGALSGTTGTFSINAFDLNNTSTPSSDNCSITSYLINGQARDTFDCSMTGLNTAVLTVTDQNGNTDTCNAIVNVQDITNPTVSCRFITNLTLDSTGQSLIAASSLLISANDNCGVDSVIGNGLDTLIFTCADIGGTQIQVIAIDSSGNQSSACNAIVNVSDITPPVAICPTLPVYLNATGNVTVQAQEIDSASYDNCGIVSWLINGQNSIIFTCNNIGAAQQATLTIEDASGLTGTCLATIEVLDTIPPVAICTSFIAILNADGFAEIIPNQIDSNSFDNCGSFNLTYAINGASVDTFYCANVGSPTTATLSVTDVYGNTSTCVANIDVVDQTDPDLICIGTTQSVYLGQNGLINLDPEDLAVGASDSCTILTWYIDGLQDTTFTCADLNVTHQVVIRVEDPSGNFDECNALIRVLDTIAPAQGNPVCASLGTVSLNAAGGVEITGAQLSSFNVDNCSIVDTLINGQTSITYDCDSLGLRNAVLTLIDPSGNTSTCTTSFVIADDIDPIARCYDTLQIFLNQAGVAVVAAYQLDSVSVITNAGTSSDICGIVSFLINNEPTDTFNCTRAGIPTPAILTVIDAAGNTGDCVVILNIEDETPPTVICQDVDVFLSNGSGTVTLQATQVDNGSYDACGINTILFNNGANSMQYTCADTGVQSITILVTDVNGNVDSCTATLTVRDTTAPVPNCRSVDVDLNAINSVVLQPVSATVDPYGVLDNLVSNCGIDTIFVTPNTITCTDVGHVIFTVTAIDHSGNVGTCQDTVFIILDLPTILIPTQDTVLCEGETLPLVAAIPSNGISYFSQWDGPTGQITFNPNTRDTVITNITILDEGWQIFTITPPSGNGCPASDSIYLDVNQVLPPVLTGVEPCDGDTAILYLGNSSTYVGSTITYNWYFNGNLISNNTDSLIIPNMSVADSGSYSMSIQVTEGPAICFDSSDVGFDFDVLDLPEPPVPTANVPCEEETLTLLNNAPGNTYSWSGPAGFSTVVPDPTRSNTTQAFAGLYTVTITDGNNCSNSGSVNVVIRPRPEQPNLFYTEPLCVGDLLELQDTSSYNFPPVVYYWESPSGVIDTTTIGQLILSGANTGDYMLTVSMNGCPSTTRDTTTVTYEVVPTGSDDYFTIVFRDSLTSATIGGNNIINNDNPNASGYLLSVVDSTGGGTVQLNQATGTLNYYPRSGYFGVDTMYYSICDIQCPNSCDTVEVLIEVTTDFECFIPQGISPNGDGINDQLIVRCLNEYPNATMEVFSRWGTLVYEGSPTGWNGQFNSKDLPDGTYFYIMKLNDTSHTGTGSNKSEGRVGDQYSGYIMLQR